MTDTPYFVTVPVPVDRVMEVYQLLSMPPPATKPTIWGTTTSRLQLDAESEPESIVLGIHGEHSLLVDVRDSMSTDQFRLWLATTYKYAGLRWRCTCGAHGTVTVGGSTRPVSLNTRTRTNWLRHVKTVAT